VEYEGARAAIVAGLDRQINHVTGGRRFGEGRLLWSSSRAPDDSWKTFVPGANTALSSAWRRPSLKTTVTSLETPGVGGRRSGARLAEVVSTVGRRFG
jgi:hypothetical protein